MESFDDRIRQMAAEIRSAEELRIADEKRAKEMQQLHIQDTQHLEQSHGNAVRVLCGRFAVWATNNGIPYNSPALLAPGWLLGRTEGPPYYSVSMHGIQGSGASEVSLLVRHTGIVGELVTRNCRKSGAKHSIFPRRAKPENFPMESILESIAEFSGDYKRNW